jgi:hypothetical protein
MRQITSKQYDDLHALSLKESDFLSGGKEENHLCPLQRGQERACA